MGNYENLKQSITEVIKTNGNQEITGSILQNVLLTIISTVGANAAFAGIATPTTNPGTPDGSVFYLASESGTYSNFGSIELQDGLSVLMWNGSWSGQRIFGVDDEPTAGSGNLVKSGGVLNVINKNSNSYSLMVASLINTQKYFLKKGDIETAAGYYNIINDEIQLIPADPNTSIRRCIAINCEGLGIVSVKNVGIEGTAYKVIVRYVDDTNQGWSLTNTGDIANLEKDAKILYLNFFDGSDADGFELSANNAFLSLAQQNNTDAQQKQARSNLGLGDGDIDTFPTKDSHRITDSNSNYYGVQCGAFSSNAQKIDYTLRSEGGYFTYEGNYISSGSYIGCEVDVTPYVGKYLVVYGSVDTENNVTCALLLDGSDNIIGRTKMFYSNKDYEAIYIPNGAAKFCFTKLNDSTAYCFVSDALTDYYIVNFGFLNKSDVFTPYGGWRTTDYIPVNTGDKITMTISCETVCYAIACYGKDKTIIASKSIGGISGVNSYSLTISEDVAYIRICFYNNLNTIINISHNIDMQKYYKKYDNIIRKPFDFNGKHAVWFGDSITYGYLAGAENNRTTTPFPKAFSEAVGLSSQFDYGNRGSNGASIVPTTSTQTNNLTNSVTNYPLDFYGTPDIVFIAGGINDLQLGTDWDTFKTGMEAFADAINTKFDASIPVVFITPINARAAILGTSHPLSELVKIRNIMTTAILKKDVYNRFSIIQGDKLPFPLMTEDTAMSDILFSDGVHLTEYGYKVYSAYLQGVLC